SSAIRSGRMIPKGAASGDALLPVAQRELLRRDAERAPVGGLGHDALERADLGVRDMRLGAAERDAAVAHLPRRVDPQAAQIDDPDVARAEPLLGAVGDAGAAHRLPHGDVLVGNAGDAGEVAELHRLAVLQVVVVARAPVAEVLVEIDAGLRAVELAPALLVDAWLVLAVPGDEVEVA